MNIVNWTAPNKSNVPVLALSERYANEKKTIYINSIETDRQSTGPRPCLRHRGSIINASVTAPDTTLTDVKLAASMRCRPKASRQISGLAANASIAMTVSNLVLATVKNAFFRSELFTLRWMPE
jgi:hypothetical protein